MNYSPAIQVGLHLTESDGHFRLATSLRNPLDEAVALRTMDSGLFHVTLKERTFTEEGTRTIWTPNHGFAQAVTHWTLDAEATATSHYDVPNKEMARETALEWLDEGLLMLDDDEREEIRTNQEELDALVEDYASFNYVEPDEAGVLRIETSVPSSGEYHESVTRQVDLRTNRHRGLDDNLPPEDMSGIERKT